MGALLSSAAVASAQLVAYPNGAVAPFYGYNGYNGYYPGYAGAYGYGAGYLGYNGYNGYPYASALVAHPNGAVVPADTPAQHAAKVEHFAAKGEAYAAHGLAPYAYAAAPYVHGHPAVYAAGYAGLVAHPNGALVPAEPADVVAARQEHLAAHHAA